MAPTNPIIREEADARECLNDYPKIKLLSTMIRDRKVYRDAMSGGLGLGVVEMDNPKAKAEIKKLVEGVL